MCQTSTTVQGCSTCLPPTTPRLRTRTISLLYPMVAVASMTTASCMHHLKPRSIHGQQWLRPCLADIRQCLRQRQPRYTVKRRCTIRRPPRRSARRQLSPSMEKHLHQSESPLELRIPAANSMTSKVNLRHTLRLCQRPRLCRPTTCHIHWSALHDFQAISTRRPTHHRSL